jgi:hypothetical protein
MQGYTSSRAHLVDEMHRFDVLLNLHIARQRCDQARASFNEFRGLFLAEDEIDLLVGATPRQPEQPGAPEADAERLLSPVLAQLDRQIAQKTSVALEHGVHLALRRYMQKAESGPDLATALRVL